MSFFKYKHLQSAIWIVFAVLCNFIMLVFGASGGLASLQQRNTLKHNALQVDNTRLEYLHMEQTLWKFLNRTKAIWQAELKRPEKLTKIYDAHLRVINTSHMREQFVMGKYEFSKRLPLTDDWITLERELWKVEHYFQQLQNYIGNTTGSEHLEENILMDFTSRILRNDSYFSLHTIFQNIETLMVNNTFYYRAMSEIIDQVCNLQQSQQQFVYTLYSDVARTELKGYIMLQFAWMILSVYGKGDFIPVSQKARMNYLKRTERNLRQMHEILKHADRTVWSCDPTKFVKGESYEEITRLVQGYIENEVDMNRDGTCRNTCSYYQVAKSESCLSDKYCARQHTCSGELYDCVFVESNMDICQEERGKTRRYEYIEYTNGRVLGKKTSCRRPTIRAESWMRFLFWQCSYCFCLCDETSMMSDRYFNLRDSLSDVANNRVVTGLRFVKKNRVIHMKIQEGELMPYGIINVTSLSWRPTANYRIHDTSIHNGIDYHKLHYKSRVIDLDDILTDDNAFVVTGVRFRLVGTHLNLEARFSEFNYETGKLLNPNYSIWKSNDNTEVSGQSMREKLQLYEPDVSTRCIVKSLPDSKHNQYVAFEPTSLEKDAAQTTVPFIDTQRVTPRVPVPLSGIGIYHKGRFGYGGYIAPKIMTYNYTPHTRGSMAV